MNRTFRTPSLSRGFSLIEVMIAVVVLATGLLALAALQASLTRASADSKTRSRVSAMLSARMDELRGSGYDNTLLDPGGVGAVTSTTGDCKPDTGNPPDVTDWIDCTRKQANLTSLTVNQTNQLFTSDVGAASFATVNSRGGVTSGNPEFIRVTLTASWKTADADSGAQSSGTHSMSMISEFSALALRDSLLPPPPGSNTPTGGPIVRTDNPVNEKGVIPVAVGEGDATAASNPRPEMIGKKENVVAGTRFDVLTYAGYSPAPTTAPAVIQRRVETTVIKCQCQLGAGGTNLPTIYQKSEWPAIWTGERYDLYKPTTTTSPAGQGKNSGPKPNVEQNPLCQECCRDHFDPSGTTHAKFDAERTDAHDHYLINSGGALVKAAATDVNYIESCRLIRVDGFWRTAADMYARQYGLLETETVNGKEAATGLPDATAVTKYTAFVKDYLAQVNGTSATPPTNAPALFDQTARGLNLPDDVDIPLATNKDLRYLHGRGLYLDHLEAKARDKIKKVLADTGTNGACPTGSDTTECILPYLPFTTINATELSIWRASDTAVLTVNSETDLRKPVGTPSGGQTFGRGKGTADNNVKINMSNFGLAATSDPTFTINAATVLGVDAEDAAAIGTDKQAFDVGGDNSGGSNANFYFLVQDTTLPQVPVGKFSVYSPDDTGDCGRQGASGPFTCGTDNPTFSGGRVTFSNYNYEVTPPSSWPVRSITGMCTDSKGVTVAVTDTIKVPKFVGYQIMGIVISGSNTPGTRVQLSNDKKMSESDTWQFDTLQPNDTLLVDLKAESLADSQQYASIKSCTTNGGHNKIDYPPDWNKPWEN